MPRTILSLSRDHILLETRGAILRKSGHRVLSVGSLGEFLESLRDNQVDLVILGHSLPSHDRDEAFKGLQEVECGAPVIELYATSVPPKSQAQFQLAVHDRTFQADLLGLVTQVLSGKEN